MARFVSFLLIAAIAAAPAVAQDGGDAATPENNTAAENGQVLEQLAARLDMPIETLEAQQSGHGLSHGQLLIANSLAQATGESFDAIVSEFRSGKGWGEIAGERDVRLGEAVSEAVRAEEASANSRRAQGLERAGEGRAIAAERQAEAAERAAEARANGAERRAEAAEHAAEARAGAAERRAEGLERIPDRRPEGPRVAPDRGRPANVGPAGRPAGRPSSLPAPARGGSRGRR